MRDWMFRAGVAIGVIAVTVIGLTGAAGPCADCLKTRYWRVPGDDYRTTRPVEFPEAERLRNRRDVGVAFSGGGTRSATATLGQLRGLEQNHWLERVRYVSAVSGGGWAAIPFTFSKIPLPDLLGRYEAPGSLDARMLKEQANGRMARAIADSSLAAGSVRETTALLLKLGADKIGNETVSQVLSLVDRRRREANRPDKTYARLLADIFIDPLVEPGVKTSDRFFAWDAAAVAEVSALNPGMIGNFVLAHPDRPFLIAGGTMVSARRDYAYPLLMPVEYTPLYVGVRQEFGGRFGGTYVWPWAYDPIRVGTRTPDARRALTGTIEVGLDSTRRFTLADVAASTGAAPELATVVGDAVPAAFRSQFQSAARLFPAFRHFSAQSQPGSGVVLTNEMPHADGGASDNLGVMPLLARGVGNVLVFINTSTPYAEDNDDLQAMFFSIGPADATGDKRHNVVFEPARYSELVRGFVEARERGDAQVVCSKGGWRVLPNQHYNIRGYAGLNICFFYNAAVPRWEAELPDGSVRQMVKGTSPSKDGSNVDNFPWFSTFEQNKPHLIQLTVAQVNLLSNLTSWTVVNEQSAQLVRDAMPPLR